LIGRALCLLGRHDWLIQVRRPKGVWRDEPKTEKHWIGTSTDLRTICRRDGCDWTVVGVTRTP
jgi:hypothetical protein